MKNVVVLRMKKEQYDKVKFLELDYDEVVELDGVETLFRTTLEDIECDEYDGVAIDESMLYDLPEKVVDVYDNFTEEDDRYAIVIYSATSTDPYDCQDDEEEEWY